MLGAGNLNSFNMLRGVRYFDHKKIKKYSLKIIVSCSLKVYLTYLSNEVGCSNHEGFAKCLLEQLLVRGCQIILH